MVEYGAAGEGSDVAYAMSWEEFKELVERKFCPSYEKEQMTNKFLNHQMVDVDCRGEIHDIVKAARPRIIDDAAELDNTLTDGLLYGKRYLRNPTWNDLQQLYEVHLENHGIPDMIGSLDCLQWRWYNCPTAWRSQHTQGDQKGPTLVLQAVASYDLWIWSAFFGVAGCMNDINTFECSPLSESYISGTIPKAGFHANGNDYKHGYYLGDGIYPEY
ncbi:uncharacterized protein LOC110887656 [Helianthus annuus]|uniref:uncharacterized protein LOC110887656 n=1 Tax=Helianthus annuus TaxID=4232 RepID=UPI000B90629D|nr:uncharacterized protein LOC110887656 [Helianthus annuus]